MPLNIPCPLNVHYDVNEPSAPQLQHLILLERWEGTLGQKKSREKKIAKENKASFVSLIACNSTIMEQYRKILMAMCSLYTRAQQQHHNQILTPGWFKNTLMGSFKNSSTWLYCTRDTMMMT